MSLIFVDSCCDLDKEYIKKLGIECIDLPYSINDKTFSFDDSFDYKKFYSKCKKGVIINNVPLKENEYINVFDKCLSLGDDIIYIHSSSNILDDTNLINAKNTLCEIYPDRKFELIDSQNFSVGQGLVSIALSMMYRRGDSVKEIVDASNSITDEYAMYFATGSSEQMCNKGLIDSNSVSGSMLNIRPIYTIDIDGKVALVDKVSGKKKSVLKLLELCRQHGSNVVDYPIAVVYGNDEVIAKELFEKLKEHFGSDAQIFMTQMSPASVGVLGDSVLGIAFHVHKKII